MDIGLKAHQHLWPSGQMILDSKKYCIDYRFWGSDVVHVYCTNAVLPACSFYFTSSSVEGLQYEPWVRQ